MAGFSSILINNPFGIGDCLFSTSLIRNLLDAYPGVRFYYLCNPKTAKILSSQPFIYKTFVYDRDEWVRLKKHSLAAWWKKFSSLIADIRREHIQLCIDLSLNTQYGFYAWCAGIPLRIGLDYKNRCFFLNKKIKIDGYSEKHVVDYYLDVLRLLGLKPQSFGLQIKADDESRSWAEQFFRSSGLGPHELVIGIACCGGDAFGKDAYVKRWPAEKFRELIERLRKELKATIFIFAGPKEKDDVQGVLGPISDRAGIFDFCDRSLPETVALIERINLFIGNDTGPLRFADAFGKKIVAFFGPVDEKVYGPYPTDEKRAVVLTHAVSCRPCYRRFKLPECVNDRICLKSISVEEAFDAVKRLVR
ncbi:MAG: glycosyltransferase family 9 protein [Candidatus Omnitrophica bacterium]|nr:glycosyltransferase family 9 protein [Candidatus Omnitrophota bacterium]